MKFKWLGDFIPREVFAYVIYSTLRGLFMPICVHIGLILTNIIYETLNIHKIVFISKNNFACINVVKPWFPVKRIYHLLLNNTESEIQVSRRWYSERSICLCNLLNASRLAYANLCSHRLTKANLIDETLNIHKIRIYSQK